nr:GyrI-like domain-containing protein [Syntrophomonas zehnderi]
MWKNLFDFVATNKLSFPSTSLNIAIYHDVEYRDKEIDVEVQKEISTIVKGSEAVRCFMRPAVLAATVTLQGELSFYSELNSVIAHWVSHNGYDLDGPMFNIYHIAPDANADNQSPITEVCFPIRTKENG